jgi:Cys-rich protein (TIGR01571 family)
MLHEALFVSCLALASSEQHLRGEPTVSLATEGDAVVVAKATVRKSLLSFFKGAADGSSADWFNDLADIKSFGIMNTGEIFLTFIVWLTLYFMLAAYYQRYVLYYEPPDSKDATVKKHQENHFQEFREFRTGLFECSKHPEITFWACVCPGIRWADTMGKIGVHSFWKSFCILTSLYCISFFPIATVVCYIIVITFMTYHRQQLRAVFDFDEQGFGVAMGDCVTYLCCMCCAVAQEARQTRQACKVGHPCIRHDEIGTSARDPLTGGVGTSARDP